MPVQGDKKRKEEAEIKLIMNDWDSSVAVCYFL